MISCTLQSDFKFTIHSRGVLVRCRANCHDGIHKSYTYWLCVCNEFVLFHPNNDFYEVMKRHIYTSSNLYDMCMLLWSVLVSSVPHTSWQWRVRCVMSVYWSDWGDCGEHVNETCTHTYTYIPTVHIEWSMCTHSHYNSMHKWYK